MKKILFLNAFDVLWQVRFRYLASMRKLPRVCISMLSILRLHIDILRFFHPE